MNWVLVIGTASIAYLSSLPADAAASASNVSIALSPAIITVVDYGSGADGANHAVLTPDYSYPTAKPMPVNNDYAAAGRIDNSRPLYWAHADEGVDL
jgi:hypothetical protein